MISKEMKSSSSSASSSSLSSKEVYECIFCKRGFSTAQALGGHMNVHRKDRAKATASPTPITPNPPVPFPASNNSMSTLLSEVQMMGKYSTSDHQTKYFPAEISTGEHCVVEGGGRAYSRPASFPINAPSTSIIDFFDQTTGKEIIVEESSTSELDLELRLGHA